MINSDVKISSLKSFSTRLERPDSRRRRKLSLYMSRERETGKGALAASPFFFFQLRPLNEKKSAVSKKRLTARFVFFHITREKVCS